MTNKEIKHRLEELDRKESKIMFSAENTSADNLVLMSRIKTEKGYLRKILKEQEG